VHQRQHYRLGSWRRGNTELNYRRFFDITTLAAVRVEDPEVSPAPGTGSPGCRSGSRPMIGRPDEVGADAWFIHTKTGGDSPGQASTQGPLLEA
jgi:hypothetical protein